VCGGSVPSGSKLESAWRDRVEECRSIGSALAAAEVEFAAGGGWAVAIHARPRATLDVDLLLPRDPIGRARAVARRLGDEIETGAMIRRKNAIEMFPLSQPDPETGDLRVSIGSSSRPGWSA
jgi:hypothetical protein